MKKKTLTAVVAVIVLAAIIYFLFGTQKSDAGTFMKDKITVVTTNGAGRGITNNGAAYFPVSITFRCDVAVTPNISVSRIDGSGNSNFLFRVSPTSAVSASGGPDFIHPIYNGEQLRVDDGVTNSLNIEVSSEFYP